jgi:hypothetical protein
MAKIRVTAIMDIPESYDLSDAECLQSLKDELNDKENIVLIIHSNDIGDEICSTNDFKYKLILDEER